MSAHRYSFKSSIAMSEVEASLLLSLWATEALHGESTVRLEASYDLDETHRSLQISSATAVGRDLNRILIGFLRREFQSGDFQVERVAGRDHDLAWKDLPAACH